jgi:hypothetical protein
MSRLKNFSYAYDEGAGPLSENELKAENFTEGNCRRAVQYFLYKTKNIFVRPEDVLLPNGYRNIGKFIFKEEPIDFKKLKTGDIIYAENLRNKKNEPLNKTRSGYTNEDGWLKYLHSAIYLGQFNDELSGILPNKDYPENVPLIWHSTFIDGGTCVWTLDKFNLYYKPISAKRLSHKIT